MTPLEVLDRGDTRVGTDAGDLPRLAGTSDVDEDRRHPGDADHVGMDDAERDPGGDAGIDRVAAGAQHAGGGLRGQRMAGSDRPRAADGLDGMSGRVRGCRALGGRGVE